MTTLTDAQVEEVRTSAQATWNLATEVLQLRHDNARLRRVVRGLLNVNAEGDDQFTLSAAQFEARHLLNAENVA